MNKYLFFHLLWLLPIYFVFQNVYQVQTYFGVQDTYNNGDSYIATVEEFDVKQIAAQTNGYVVLRFETSENEIIQEQLSLPVQFAQVIMNSELIPVRYKKSSRRPIVMMPIYDLQNNVLLVNMAVTLFGIIATAILSIYASRFATRKIKEGEVDMQIEFVDEQTSPSA